MTRIAKPRLEPADAPHDETTDAPLKDAFTQIREARDRMVASVIDRAIAEGSYQHAKWLFELGGIVPEGRHSPEDEPSLARLLLDKFQIPESDDESNDLAANDRAVE